MRKQSRKQLTKRAFQQKVIKMTAVPLLSLTVLYFALGGVSVESINADGMPTGELTTQNADQILPTKAALTEKADQPKDVDTQVKGESIESAKDETENTVTLVSPESPAEVNLVSADSPAEVNLVSANSLKDGAPTEESNSGKETTITTSTAVEEKDGSSEVEQKSEVKGSVDIQGSTEIKQESNMNVSNIIQGIIAQKQQMHGGSEKGFKYDASAPYGKRFQWNFMGRTIYTSPLVIHYDKKDLSNRLTDEFIPFDLNFDGEMDYIPFVTQGTGFLAMDKNGDGVINDGRELFGPATDDGFRELADYDKNADGSIDMKDDVYNKLVLWTKDMSGKDTLTPISEKGINSISIKHVMYYGESEKEIVNSTGDKTGYVLSSSEIVNKNDSVGIIEDLMLMRISEN